MIQNRQACLRKLADKHVRPVQLVAPRPENTPRSKSPLFSPKHGTAQAHRYKPAYFKRRIVIEIENLSPRLWTQMMTFFLFFSHTGWSITCPQLNAQICSVWYKLTLLALLLVSFFWAPWFIEHMTCNIIRYIHCLATRFSSMAVRFSTPPLQMS